MDNIWMPMHDFEAIRDLMTKDDAQLFRDFYNSQQIKHMNYLLIAQVAHEVNRAYCLGIGDTSQKSWEEAEHGDYVTDMCPVVSKHHLLGPQQRYQ